MQPPLRTRGAGGASLDSAGVGFSGPRASSSLPEVFTVLGCTGVVLRCCRAFTFSVKHFGICYKHSIMPVQVCHRQTWISQPTM